MSLMGHRKFLLNKTKICKSDKAWMTPSIKIAIAKRQKAFHIYGKNSKVQEVSTLKNLLKNSMK